jgi:hypothetical protein
MEDKNVIKLTITKGARRNIGIFLLCVAIVETILIIVYAGTNEIDVGLAAIMVPLGGIVAVLIGAFISDYRVKFGNDAKPLKKMGKYYGIAFLLVGGLLGIIFGLLSVLDPLIVLPILLVLIFGTSAILIVHFVRKDRKEKERLGIVKEPTPKTKLNLSKKMKITIIILLSFLVILFIIAGVIINEWNSSY